MNPYALGGQFLGALFPAFFISRLVLWFLKTWDGKYKKAIFSHAVSLMAITLIGGMGRADGGAFAPLIALEIAFLPQMLLLVIDLVVLRRKNRFAYIKDKP